MASKADLIIENENLKKQIEKLQMQLNQGVIVRLEESNASFSIDGKVVRVRIDDDGKSINFNTLDHIPVIRPVSINRLNIMLEVS